MEYTIGGQSRRQIPDPDHHLLLLYRYETRYLLLIKQNGGYLEGLDS